MNKCLPRVDACYQKTHWPPDSAPSCGAHWGEKKAPHELWGLVICSLQSLLHLFKWVAGCQLCTVMQVPFLTFLLFEEAWCLPHGRSNSPFSTDSTPTSVRNCHQERQPRTALHSLFTLKIIS